MNKAGPVSAFAYGRVSADFYLLSLLVFVLVRVIPNETSIAIVNTDQMERLC